MLIERNIYLNKLISYKDTELIKVITGIRRSGKSILLFNLYYNYLIQEGIKSKYIIKIDLETQSNKKLRNAEELYNYIINKIIDKDKYYIFIDEIQLVEEFEDIVNGIKKEYNCDIYITGSNSKLLSKDINTKLRGRSIEIKVYPLTFKEYYSYKNEDINKAYNEYMLYGGLPYLLQEENNDLKIEYLNMICNTVVIKDIIDRYKIKNTIVFEAVFDFLCSNIGSIVSANKITNTLKSNGYKIISVEAVDNYLNYLCDSYLFYKVYRYDIKGKEYLKTLNKYYISDLGIRNSRLNYRQLEVTHTLENIIYLELISRGYTVDIGKNDIKEIDFIAKNNKDTYYIQVAYSIVDSDKRKQELDSFKKIDDGYKKIIITMDNDPYNLLENGYKKLNVFDFLLNTDILEQI
ncbi:MAG: ATP-binding protein [Erysipelotrichaceae bacterium]